MNETIDGPRAMSDLTIHLVYPDGPLLTAACGQSLDDGHTGHYASSVRQDRDWGRPVCDACLHLLETP